MSRKVTQVNRDGWVFNVVDSGPQSAETSEIPVVLLHGFPERASCWTGVTALLNEHGLRTVAPDQRGYSRGARPQPIRDYRMDELIDDVIALADALDAPRFHLVGHDWGACVAYLVAARYPDRVTTLTTLAVPHPAAFIRAMPHGQAVKSWYMAFFQLPKLPERALTYLARSGGGPGRRFELYPGYCEYLSREIVDDGALTGGLNWYRAMRYQSMRSLADAVVRVPTTYVYGDKDSFLSKAGARGCAAFIDAPYEFIVADGVDHWMPERVPELIADAIVARVTSVPN